MQTCRQPVFGASATLRKAFGAVMNHSIEWYKVTNLRLKMVRFVKNQCNFAYCTLLKYTDVTVIPSMSTRFVTGIQYTSVISSRFRLAFVAPFCHLETFPETQNCRTGSQAKPCSECSRPLFKRVVSLRFLVLFPASYRRHKHGTNGIVFQMRLQHVDRSWQTTPGAAIAGLWGGRVQRKGLWFSSESCERFRQKIQSTSWISVKVSSILLAIWLVKQSQKCRKMRRGILQTVVDFCAKHGYFIRQTVHMWCIRSLDVSEQGQNNTPCFLLAKLKESASAQRNTAGFSP